MELIYCMGMRVGLGMCLCVCICVLVTLYFTMAAGNEALEGRRYVVNGMAAIPTAWLRTEGRGEGGENGGTEGAGWVGGFVCFHFGAAIWRWTESEKERK